MKVYTLRCTGHVIKRLPYELTGEANLPAPTTRLGNWYANRLNVGPRRLVLCTNERSLLCVIVPARDPRRLPMRLAAGLDALLARLGVAQERISAELSQMNGVVFARTASRRVLGSMNDFALAAPYFFKGSHGSEDLTDLGEWLADTPCGPLSYGCPMDVAARILAAE
jgi:hypothetical protein